MYSTCENKQKGIPEWKYKMRNAAIFHITRRLGIPRTVTYVTSRYICMCYVLGKGMWSCIAPWKKVNQSG